MIDAEHAAVLRRLAEGYGNRPGNDALLALERAIELLDRETQAHKCPVCSALVDEVSGHHRIVGI